MKRYGYDIYQYLIFANKDLTQEYFVSKSGVLDGYAKELFIRIYKSLFSESDDVKHIYETFYLDEYGNFELFLMGVYGLTEDDAHSIQETLSTNPSLRLYDYKSLSVGENFDDFICSDEMYQLFQKLLMMKV